MRFLPWLLLLCASPALAQNFGNIKPHTVIGNADPTNSKPGQPIPFEMVSPGVTPLMFGAVGDGVANDTAAVNAAASVAIATKVPLLITRMYKVDPLDFTAGAITIVGPTKGGYYRGQQTDQLECPVGFTNTTLNADLIRLTGNSTVQGLCIDMMHIGPQSSAGRAITNETVCDLTGPVAGWCQRGHDVSVRDVLITGPCIGIALSGVNLRINNVFIANLYGNGCGGVRIGAMTNNHNSGTVIDSLVTFGRYGTTDAVAADYGLMIRDTGGAKLTNNGLQTTKYGLILQPGTLAGVGAQNIQAIDSSNNYWGDTPLQSAILIDAVGGAIGFTIGTNVFVNDWVAGGNWGVTIQNTSGGGTKVGDFKFVNLRSRGHASGCINIPGSNVYNITFIGLDCQDATLGGVYIPNGAPDVTFIGSYFRNSSGYAPAPSAMPYCFNFGTGMQRVVVADNNLSGCTSPFVGTTDTGPGTTIIANNQGIDNVIPSVTLGSTITLPVNPTVLLNGTGTVTTITADPNIRHIILCPNTVTFSNSGGNIFNNATCSATASLAVFAGSSWIIK